MIDLTQLSDATLACHLTMHHSKWREASETIAKASSDCSFICLELISRGLDPHTSYPYQEVIDGPKTT